MLPNPQHFGRICRICLSSADQLIDLFNSSEDLLDLIVSIASVSIAVDDNMPQQICAFCSHQIKSTHYFILKCQESDRKLRSCLHGSYDDTVNTQTVDENLQNEDVEPIIKDTTVKRPQNTQRPRKRVQQSEREQTKRIVIQDELAELAVDETGSVDKDSKSQHICHICNKTFARQTNFERHKLKHETKANNFECTICGKQTKHINHFKMHMRTHKDFDGNIPSNEEGKKKKQFLCSTCGRACTSRSNLAVHTRRHTGKMTNFCEICGKGYPRSTDLTIHLRKHTGEKPFICSICNRGFTRSDKLTIHIRTHTGEKPYSCTGTGCTRSFAQRNDLISHQRRNVCGNALRTSENEIHVDNQVNESLCK